MIPISWSWETELLEICFNVSFTKIYFLLIIQCYALCFVAAAANLPSASEWSNNRVKLKLDFQFHKIFVNTKSFKLLWANKMLFRKTNCVIRSLPFSHDAKFYRSDGERSISWQRILIDSRNESLQKAIHWFWEFLYFLKKFWRSQHWRVKIESARLWKQRFFVVVVHMTRTWWKWTVPETVVRTPGVRTEHIQIVGGRKYTSIDKYRSMK